MQYHDAKAGNFVTEIIQFLEKGKTVILDLGMLRQELMEYFSIHLSAAVFHRQVGNFLPMNWAITSCNCTLRRRTICSLPTTMTIEPRFIGVFAKEGANTRFGDGLLDAICHQREQRSAKIKLRTFSSPHLASQDEVNALARVNVTYESMKDTSC